MQIGVDIVVLGHGGPLSIVKEPDGFPGGWDGTELDLVPRAGSIDVCIQAVMEQIVSVASGAIGRADPETFRWFLNRICSPGQGVIVRYAQLCGEIDVPALAF